MGENKVQIVCVSNRNCVRLGTTVPFLDLLMRVQGQCWWEYSDSADESTVTVLLKVHFKYSDSSDKSTVRRAKFVEVTLLCILLPAFSKKNKNQIYWRPQVIEKNRDCVEPHRLVETHQ